jgi:hypothetical protein
MELFADSMPDLVAWVQEHAPTRKIEEDDPDAWLTAPPKRTQFDSWQEELFEQQRSTAVPPSSAPTSTAEPSFASASEEPESIFIVHGHD